jgi:hypothetical protein
MARAPHFLIAGLLSLSLLACQRTANLPHGSNYSSSNDQVIADTSAGILQAVERMKQGSAPCTDSACERAVAPIRSRGVTPTR